MHTQVQMFLLISQITITIGVVGMLTLVVLANPRMSFCLCMTFAGMAGIGQIYGHRFVLAGACNLHTTPVHNCQLSRRIQELGLLHFLPALRHALLEMTLVRGIILFIFHPLA
jgi:hypothetical protein